MKFEDIVRLAFCQSLIMGHCPDKLSLDKVAGKTALTPCDLESFGLFDTATPNYNTYYPEVTAEDLQPKDDEFIYPVFRLLSEVIVHKNWNPIDFSMNGVLRPSMKMLLGQTINIDHETAIGNAIGAVDQISWQESYTSKNGIQVPAGINGRLKIDGKSNPKIARGIMMNPPSIHSNSVTVQFEWEKSHPKMLDNEFFNSLGKYGPDKQLIRRIATKVRDYRETSLVGAGADPYARIVKEGEILDPGKSARAYNSLGARLTTKLFSFSYKTDIIGNATPPEEEETIPESFKNKDPENNPESTMNKTLAFLAALVGKTVEELNNDDAASVALQAYATAHNVLVTSEGTLKTQLATLTAEKTALQEFKDAATLKDVQEAQRLYGLLNPGVDNTTMLAAIAKYDQATAQVSIKSFQSLLDEKMPVTCNSCHSTDVSRASVVTGTGGNGNDSKGKVKTHAETLAELTKVNMDLSTMHAQ